MLKTFFRHSRFLYGNHVGFLRGNHGLLVCAVPGNHCAWNLYTNDNHVPLRFCHCSRHYLSIDFKVFVPRSASLPRSVCKHSTGNTVFHQRRLKPCNSIEYASWRRKSWNPPPLPGLYISSFFNLCTRWFSPRHNNFIHPLAFLFELEPAFFRHSVDFWNFFWTFIPSRRFSNWRCVHPSYNPVHTICKRF